MLVRGSKVNMGEHTDVFSLKQRVDDITEQMKEGTYEPMMQARIDSVKNYHQQ